MDDTKPKLLPCPFCGGTKVYFYPLHRPVTHKPHRSHPVVRCHGCSAQINGEENDCGFDAETAIAAWNRRTPPAEDTP